MWSPKRRSPTPWEVERPDALSPTPEMAGEWLEERSPRTEVAELWLEVEHLAAVVVQEGAC